MFRKAFLMSLTIFAPEMMVGSAIGEYLLAINKRSTKRRGIEWTATHGFYALMGGFVVKIDETTYLPISAKGILRLESRHDIHTSIREIKFEDIIDKSKSDILAKCITCLQSLWLVMGCAARANQGLPITVLELATTGYVGCTVVSYVFFLS